MTCISETKQNNVKNHLVFVAWISWRHNLSCVVIKRSKLSTWRSSIHGQWSVSGSYPPNLPCDLKSAWVKCIWILLEFAKTGKLTVVLISCQYSNWNVRQYRYRIVGKMCLLQHWRTERNSQVLYRRIFNDLRQTFSRVLPEQLAQVDFATPIYHQSIQSIPYVI